MLRNENVAINVHVQSQSSTCPHSGAATRKAAAKDGGVERGMCLVHPQNYVLAELQQGRASVDWCHVELRVRAAIGLASATNCVGKNHGVWVLEFFQEFVKTCTHGMQDLWGRWVAC